MLTGPNRCFPPLYSASAKASGREVPHLLSDKVSQNVRQNFTISQNINLTSRNLSAKKLIDSILC